ncbi:MAG: adenylate/guanylate cyclase domain-containing protein [Burkholderiaceae bacterium]
MSGGPGRPGAGLTPRRARLERRLAPAARPGLWRALRVLLLLAALLVALGHATGLAPLRFVTTLDKYIGDAIMAFWGAPLADAAHAAHATRAALAMLQRLAALNAERRARGQPEIGAGIGLNTGIVCVGDMGSSTRRSYTAMGDAVNLAARIEALTRHYGVDILAGEATRRAAGEPAPGEGWRWVEVDRVRVKGKREPVTLFTPIAAPPERTPQLDEETRLWRLALAAYRLQHWDDAQAQLQALSLGFADSPLAGLYRRFGERTAHHRATPPPDGWDGAHHFDSK